MSEATRTYMETTVMIRLHDCPKCRGAVFEYAIPALDGTLCINCGWRPRDVPRQIQAEVVAHLGEPALGAHTYSRIGTGKPSPSGWEKTKRRRERAEAARAEVLTP